MTRIFVDSYDHQSDTEMIKSALKDADVITGSDGRGARKGCDVILGPRTYQVDSDIILRKPHRLMGASGTNFATLGNTSIQFQGDYDIVIPGHRSDQRGIGIGFGAEILNVVIHNGGIVARGRVAVRGCYIWNSYHNGITIDSSSGDPDSPVESLRGPPGNANSWLVEDTGITKSKGWAMYVVGADSNAGLAKAVHVHSNLKGGFNDSAFLMNTYLACSTHESSGPSYYMDGRSSRKILLGCYEEGGGPSSYVKFADIYGGNIRPHTDQKKRGASFSAGRFRGIHKFEGLNVDLELGPVSRNQFARINSPAGQWYFGVDAGRNEEEAKTATRTLTIKAGPETIAALRITGKDSASYARRVKLKEDRAWIHDHYEGPINYPIEIIYTHSRPPEDTEGLPKGSRCKHLKPEPGDTAEWVLTSKGWSPVSIVQ